MGDGLAESGEPREPTPSGLNSPRPRAVFGPTAPEERIDSLDILRGFALFGILWANLPGGGGPALLDVVAGRMESLLVQGKFITIFAFVFGVSFSLQLDRAAKQGRSNVTYFLRRLFFLFLIGVCHCVFVWDGDILSYYALFGAYLLAVRRLPQKAILALALGVYSVSLICDEVRFTRRIARETGAVQAWRIDPAQLRERRQRMVAQEAQSYATISYEQLIRNRWNGLRESFGQGWTYFPGHSFVLFLLGLWAGRRGIFQDPRSHVRFLRHMVWLGLPAGLIMYLSRMISGELFQAGRITWLGASAFRVGENIGQPALGLAYAAAIMLLIQSQRWRPRFTPLKWAGRLALTNYLMQSLVFNAAAYGYGLGLYSKLIPESGVKATTSTLDWLQSVDLAEYVVGQLL